MTSFAVIGRGLFGSAAARHLALAGHDVTLIGPDEPVDFAVHDGVFASHYDEGRITRRLATDPVWSELACASRERYAAIEEASGIRFFTPVGAVMVGPEGGAFVKAVQGVRAGGVPAEALDARGLERRFPFLDFGPRQAGFHEPDMGHVSPRRLVAAQTEAARRAGARIVDSVVRKIDGGKILSDNAFHTFDRILVATGGYANALLPEPLDLTVYARTVAFVRLSEAEGARLGTMPSVIWRTDEGDEPYILPPIRYPDGHLYLKIGGDPQDRVLETDEIGAWFRSGGDPRAAGHMVALLRRLIPDLAVDAVHRRPCVTTFTAHGFPYVDQLDEGLFVCAGGCGAGAKSSDEIGRLGAEATLGHLDERFRAVPLRQRSRAA